MIKLDISRLNDLDKLELKQVLRKAGAIMYTDGTVMRITEKVKCKTWGVCLTPEVPCEKKCVYEAD